MDKSKIYLFQVMIISTVMVFSVGAEEPVSIPNADLKHAIELALGIPDPTAQEMRTLNNLDLSHQYITDLTGLEYAVNLYTLKAGYCYVSDLSPLSELTKLTFLDLNNNRIDDLLALRNLTNLNWLDLSENRYKDLSPLSNMIHLHRLNLHGSYLNNISPLATLKNIRELDIHKNLISDISPLAELTSLRRLILERNPLNKEAYDSIIPQIRANNPDITMIYDPYVPRYTLTLSSSPGGRVLYPGEGVFNLDIGRREHVQAQADSGFRFSHWSGDINSSETQVFITMDQNTQTRAHFLSIKDTLFVDDNAPNDIGPMDIVLSDPWENGTLERPFDSIQEAIEVASEDTTIHVRSGIYHENIDLLDKNIKLIGLDPNIYALPIIKGMSLQSQIHIAGNQDANCVLDGFFITGGVIGITCDNSSPTIKHCVITNTEDYGLVCRDSMTSIINCTITNSRGVFCENSTITLWNSIIWHNHTQSITIGSGAWPVANYSNIQNGYPGQNNLDSDPLFVHLGYWEDPYTPLDPNDDIWIIGDYHLQSNTGRWELITQSWIQDSRHSLCIDAGDPAYAIAYEPIPHGDTINMGAYGGTHMASQSKPLP